MPGRGSVASPPSSAYFPSVAYPQQRSEASVFSLRTVYYYRAGTPPMNFTEHLAATQKSTGSLLCIGLDPDPARLPAVLRGDDAVTEFNRRIIEATADLVCAYKLNLAFYETAGERGWGILRKTLSYIPGNIVTVGDAKRGDIGNSAAMYASALLSDLGFQATTVNPYMGSDSVEPFLLDPGKGAFVLALTSNPGAKDFQYLNVGTGRLYERVIR